MQASLNRKLRFVGYYRVSTDKQGRSGLGLEAQRAAVAEHVSRAGGELVGEFTEVESGKRVERTELSAALASCRASHATLIIAKLDRLARNARFLLNVVEGVGDEGVVFCDMPSLPAGPVGKFMLTQLAAVAELEAGLTSVRTKAALQAAKARGVRLGNPKLRAGTPEAARAASEAASRIAKAKAQDILPYVEAARQAGATSRAMIATALENRGVRAPRGGTRWSAAQVRRILLVAKSA